MAPIGNHLAYENVNNVFVHALNKHWQHLETVDCLQAVPAESPARTLLVVCAANRRAFHVFHRLLALQGHQT